MSRVTETCPFCREKDFEAAEEWDKEFAKQRCLQWPGAWADEMLKRSPR